MLRALRPSGLPRALYVTAVRCNAQVYEPYAGVQLDSSFSSPSLGELPSEITETDTPRGFSLINFKVRLRPSAARFLAADFILANSATDEHRFSSLAFSALHRTWEWGL